MYELYFKKCLQFIPDVDLDLVQEVQDAEARDDHLHGNGGVLGLEKGNDLGHVTETDVGRAHVTGIAADLDLVRGGEIAGDQGQEARSEEGNYSERRSYYSDSANLTSHRLISYEKVYGRSCEKFWRTKKTSLCNHFWNSKNCQKSIFALVKHEKFLQCLFLYAKAYATICPIRKQKCHFIGWTGQLTSTVGQKAN